MVLVAGLASPASAGAEGEPARADAVGGRAAAGATMRSASGYRVSLLTGDQIDVDTDGRLIAAEPAKGREKVTLRVHRLNGRTLVVPADAYRMIADGRLDQRLFDVGELAKVARLRGRDDSVRVIVGYRGAATTTRSALRAAGDTEVRRTFKALNADLVTTPRPDATQLWQTLTRVQRSGLRATAPGVDHVWLDGVREATLDKSVPQVGAPGAWAAGYDGKGVKVAVLDSGVDATHPDLRTQVIAEKNFTTTPDAGDRIGHGTHVASTVAGTGARSGGKFKGVAPGARILNGKVLGEDNSGADSTIIAGMEWAAEQGADIVSMSLGGQDRPGEDPIEATVNKLSAERGILFTISAGNGGPGIGTLGSPGSAEAALTVGAVDDKDQWADWSSVGPTADGGLKPDVTAPGVDITAAVPADSIIARNVGQNPPGYASIEGTSMSTPHVAGAAAILKQAHPDWRYAELKAALIGSAKGGPYQVLQQGAGRIQVDEAVEQSVIAEPSSVNLGTQAWPHVDDTPVTKKLTYRNLGTRDVTLNLATTGTDPKGQAVPAGFFTLGATAVTVPAGGRASVDVTADTRLGGSTDGGYSLYVAATGGGQNVRTAVGVNREVESYDVTLRYTARDGKPASADNTGTILGGTSGLGRGYLAWPEPDESGAVRLRLAKGSYLLDCGIFVDLIDDAKGTDWLVQPRLEVTRNMTVTIDARTTKPVDVTVPDARAKPATAGSSYGYTDEGFEAGGEFWTNSIKAFRTAHLGPQVARGLAQQWSSQWVRGSKAEYNTVSGGPVQKLATGYTKHFTRPQFATVQATVGAAAPGKTGELTATGVLPSVAPGSGNPVEHRLPHTRTIYLSTADQVRWSLASAQFQAEGSAREVGFQHAGPQAYRGGRTYQEAFGVGVIGPALPRNTGVRRDGDQMTADVRVYSDGKGHPGDSDYTSVRTVLYRDGVKIADDADRPWGRRPPAVVPAAPAWYELATSVTRSATVGATSTRIDASWTFRSQRTAGPVWMPLSTARLHPALGPDSTAPAGRTQSVPVTVQGAAARGSLRSLSVYASYDGGRTWKKLTVSRGKVSVRNPARGKGIAFRTVLSDRTGNTSTVSIHNAYLGR
ncbi:peptidase S8 [Actinoplanes sp. ATCC 53533]|nr:peptidase S8 [Actinoplanes sp. ATCC 53533]